jgi:hypothetical protein
MRGFMGISRESVRGIGCIGNCMKLSYSAGAVG